MHADNGAIVNVAPMCAAAFLLDIQPDIALPVAGIILLLYVLSPPRRLQQNAT